MGFKLPDPDIQTGTWEHVRRGVQRNLDALAQAVPGFGGKSVEERFGSITVTWPGASATSNAVGAPHGMGRTPVSVTATLNNAAGSGACMLTATFSATVVTVQLTTTGFAPANTVTNPVSWRAVG